MPSILSPSPPPSPARSSRLSQSAGFGCPASCIKLALAIYFTYGNVNVPCVLGRSLVSDSLRPHGLSLPGSSVHGDSPGKNTGVGCHALLQGIFPTQRSNSGLRHGSQILYHLSHQGRTSFTAVLSNHPTFFSQSPRICFSHPYLLCCPACRIVTPSF